MTGQYKSMFPPRGGLSEFYIWDNSFEVRYRANHEYEQIKLQIEAILSKEGVKFSVSMGKNLL